MTYCSDNRGAVKKAVDSGGNTTSLTYDNGDLASVRRPGGGVTNYGYDAATRNLVCVQRGAGAAQSCQSAPGGLKTTLAYANSDPLTKHFPTKITNPQGNSVTACYNGSTPACGTSTGPAGSLQSLTNQLPSQNVSRFAYNAKGNPTSLTNSRGHTTSFGYDATGSNLTSVTPPAGDVASGSPPLGRWTISRDALSRPLTVTDGKGATASYSYDKLDRAVQLAHSGGPTFGFGFDNDGNRTTLTDPSGTTAYAFDELNRLRRESFPGGSFNDYSYDPAGNLTSLNDGGDGVVDFDPSGAPIYGAGGTTSYSYNGLNQLSRATEPDGRTTSFAYNQDGARTQVGYASGATVDSAYDTLSGRLRSVTNRSPSGAVLKSYAYGYTAPDGRDTELAQTVTDQAGNRTANTYDRLDRLTDAVTSGGPSPSNFHYTFDGEGNRVRETIDFTAATGGATRTIAYDAANLPCWSAAGNVASDCRGARPSGSLLHP